MASRPTTAKRKGKQKVKAKYAKAREDAQIAGVIPTTPEGAVRVETVDPKTQGVQEFPALERQAIRSGWGVAEEKKPKIIERLTGIVENPDTKPIVAAITAKVLLQADKMQYERDNGGKGGVGTVNVNVLNQQINGARGVELPEVERVRRGQALLELMEYETARPGGKVQARRGTESGGDDTPLPSDGNEKGGGSSRPVADTPLEFPG